MGWVNNQLISLNNNTAHNKEFGLGLAIFSVFILFHSAYLHRWNFNRVRTLTDLTCAMCILAGIGTFWSNVIVTQLTIAIGVDLFSFGIAGTFIGVADIMITYSRFQLLSMPVCKGQDYIVGLYIFFFVIAANLSFYTFTPFFLDSNSEEGIYYLNIFLFYVFCPSIIVFNGVFGILFFIRVAGFRYVRLAPREQHPKMLVLAYKSIIHASMR
jgi:hypothetical protein